MLTRFDSNAHRLPQTNSFADESRCPYKDGSNSTMLHYQCETVVGVSEPVLKEDYPRVETTPSAVIFWAAGYLFIDVIWAVSALFLEGRIAGKKGRITWLFRIGSLILANTKPTILTTRMKISTEFLRPPCSWPKADPYSRLFIVKICTFLNSLYMHQHQEAGDGRGAAQALLHPMGRSHSSRIDVQPRRRGRLRNRHAIPYREHIGLPTKATK